MKGWLTIIIFLKTGDSSIKNFDFLKSFETFDDLLLDLLTEKTSINKAKREQDEMIKKTYELKNALVGRKSCYKESKESKKEKHT